MSQTAKLMAELTERLSDPNRGDDSQKMLMEAIWALNYVLTPPGQFPLALPGKFQVTSSRIKGLAEPDFRLPPDADLSDPPDLPDLFSTPASCPVMPQIEYRPRGPLENLVVGLMNSARGATDAGRRAVEAQLAQGYTSGDILPVALSSIFGGPQIQETGPTGPVVLPGEEYWIENPAFDTHPDDWIGE